MAGKISQANRAGTKACSPYLAYLARRSEKPQAPSDVGSASNISVINDRRNRNSQGDFLHEQARHASLRRKAPAAFPTCKFTDAPAPQSAGRG